ncbi:hypothetical protein B0H66DRAFT_602347 [Apodospora peruviana]|uniref:Uncharacterized protein n=1 Tax=Apodospora peruviana TaxID=516989 RepID=A0AAE0M9H9_9PEZI|nr:hypothetical protein B0H66DRAFT_602347 [Apodospora peruviana]
MRIPKHPNIVPFDALVVDKLDGVDRVVGFTTRFIPGGNLDENKTRVFKLKYLEQLISTVDYLNLTLGIVHGDTCPLEPPGRPRKRLGRFWWRIGKKRRSTGSKSGRR